MSDPDAEKVAQLRELIPATGAGIYLDTAYRGPLPAETAAAMREADDWELRVGRAGEGREEDFAQKRDEARAVIAALIGADPKEIALTGTIPSSDSFIDQVTGAIHTPAKSVVPTFLDATMVVGVIPIDVSALDVDAVYFAADRWLLGPEGTGAVWSRRRQFADSGYARTQILGLARSIGWLEMYVGLAWIYERTAALVTRLHDALSSTANIEVLTPRDALAGLVNFRIQGWPVDRTAEELRRHVFAIIGTTPDGTAIRTSVAWFNTEEELDRFAAAVADIAQYTPETLPRRPSLVVH